MKIETLWDAATIPNISDLQGNFTVKILSGPFYPFNWIYPSWQKSIYTLPKFYGYNNINRQRVGHFKIYYRPSKVTLDYNIPSNTTTFWRHLSDSLKQVKDDPNKYIGKIYFAPSIKSKLKSLNRPRFMGYFTLTKIT